MRRTLNGAAPRELRETTRDPYDWAEEPVRSALLGGQFPGTRVGRLRRLPRPLPTDRSLRACAWRVLRSAWRWLQARTPWSRA